MADALRPVYFGRISDAVRLERPGAGAHARYEFKHVSAPLHVLLP